MNKGLNKKYIFILLIGSLVLVLYSFYSIFIWFLDNREIKKINEQVQLMVQKGFEDDSPSTLVNPPENSNDSYWNYVNEEFLNVNIEELINQNSDTVAYLKVNGTEVEYPVVQGKDNDYYLNHTFTKTENKAGAIFSDYRNNLYRLNYNTIIYGHKRKDGTMFGTLKNVLNNEWFNDKENHLIKLSTLREDMIWQIFSVYTIYKESYYLIVNFNSMDSYQEFLDTMLKRSMYDFNTSVNTNDKVLTLSTCFDSYGNRIVIHAKLIKKRILKN